VKACQIYDRFDVDEEASLIGWLAQIAQHQITDAADKVNALKRSAAQAIPLDQGTADGETGAQLDPPEPALPPPALIEAAELKAIVEDCLRTLKRRVSRADLAARLHERIVGCSREGGRPTERRRRAHDARAGIGRTREVREREAAMNGRPGDAVSSAPPPRRAPVRRRPRVIPSPAKGLLGVVLLLAFGFVQMWATPRIAPHVARWSRLELTFETRWESREDPATAQREARREAAALAGLEFEAAAFVENVAPRTDIEVRVVDSEGRPIANATVLATHPEERAPDPWLEVGPRVLSTRVDASYANRRRRPCARGVGDRTAARDRGHGRRIHCDDAHRSNRGRRGDDRPRARAAPRRDRRRRGRSPDRRSARASARHRRRAVDRDRRRRPLHAVGHGARRNRRVHGARVRCARRMDRGRRDPCRTDFRSHALELRRVRRETLGHRQPRRAEGRSPRVADPRRRARNRTRSVRSARSRARRLPRWAVAVGVVPGHDAGRRLRARAGATGLRRARRDRARSRRCRGSVAARSDRWRLARRTRIGLARAWSLRRRRRSSCPGRPRRMARRRVERGA
jgi:hypothetical protein